MTRLENGKIISDALSRELISKGYQTVEGVLLSPDKVNDLIRSGYTRPHLAVGLRYTFTSTEANSLGLLGGGILGVGLVTWGAWNFRKYAKNKIENREKENL